MPSKGPVFRIFNPSGRSKEESVEKRREQVRRAQHIYRQRKTRYVKALEEDIAKSRWRECQMSKEKQDLEHQLQTLLSLLAQNGIATTDIECLSRNTAAGSCTGTHQPFTSPDGSLLRNHPDWPQGSTLTSSLSPPLIHSSDDNVSMSSRVCDIDLATLGMKFVLKVEEPCLGHVHGDHTRPDDPSGHALTVTSQLLSLSSSPPPNRSSLLPVQDAPASILNRLLVLAPTLSSQEDVTPIQAWDELRQQPVFGSLDLMCVMTLAIKLRDAAKCHGFGAVVDHTLFTQLLWEVVNSKKLCAPGLVFNTR
ncbi:uncharacterized protein F5Z01DRAFT_668160 [Emericellopsis atlantica]|uniref:BZIP domain-containing protein n=1 Tax=Emericellopsis atlantica TaxID=2614577 RepID=A0A9P7ZD40_9HYPO|nr:uncharacterized protein F5Z01DRAFT_668160 [Emericellopsis atlantica]KAG9249820.1 hypothetical protein F5Z01DRAFT_668160 [Emericellopsis atlantica]